jgi:hypothetical protein
LYPFAIGWAKLSGQAHPSQKAQLRCGQQGSKDFEAAAPGSQPQQRIANPKKRLHGSIWHISSAIQPDYGRLQRFHLLLYISTNHRGFVSSTFTFL